MRVKSIKPKSEKRSTDRRAAKRQLSVDARVAQLVRAVAKNEGMMLSDFLEEALVQWILNMRPGRYQLELEDGAPTAFDDEPEVRGVLEGDSLGAGARFERATTGSAVSGRGTRPARSRAGQPGPSAPRARKKPKSSGSTPRGRSKARRSR